MIAHWLKVLGLIHSFRVEEVASNSNIFRTLVKKEAGSSEVGLTDVGFGAMVDKTSIKESDPDYYDLTVTCFKNRLTGNQNPTIWSVNKQKMNFVERRY